MGKGNYIAIQFRDIHAAMEFLVTRCANNKFFAPLWVRHRANRVSRLNSGTK